MDDTKKHGLKKGQGGWSMLVLTSMMLALPLWLAHKRINWVPAPLGIDTETTEFSEQRALRHVHDLVDGIGDRQISSPGLSLATRYMLEQVKGIQESGLSGFDMDIQVQLETVSGAVGMSFTGINFTNAYRHLDNVVLRITPAGLRGYPAVLISSHYDSAVCSKGASDDVSQVAVMLEVARAMVRREYQKPATPLIFLWTGGEEAISPAANGWAAHSKHFKDVGAFINLESMGGGGVPIIFQHTGAWVLKAFASGSPYPRGSRTAQDIFDLHLIPADSDFRMFSARHYGSLPGIDVAFTLDSSAYHSYLDTPARMRPGILQEMGESLMGGLYPVASELAKQHTTKVKKSAVERSVFFDVLSYFMVSYPDSLAYAMHNVPLALLLACPWLQSRKEGHSLTTNYLRLLAGTLRGFMAVLGAVGLPGLLGAARVLLLGQPDYELIPNGSDVLVDSSNLGAWIDAVVDATLCTNTSTHTNTNTGKPMVFFAQHWLAPALFVPISLAGAIAPWHNVRLNARRNNPDRKGTYLASQMHGCGLVSSLVGSGLTAAGLMGTAAIFCWCSFVAYILGMIMQGPRVSGPRLLAVLVVAILPVAVAASNVGIYVVILMERMSLTGAGISVLADVIVGILHGATLLAVSCGALIPLLAYAIPVGHKRLSAVLIAFSLAIAAWAHIAAQQPYSPSAPKRVVVNHFIFSEPDPTAPATLPHQLLTMRMVNESIAIAGVDSTPLEHAAKLNRFKPAPSMDREHDVVFPLTNLLRGVTVQVPPKGIHRHTPPPTGAAGSTPGSSQAPLSQAQTPWSNWTSAQQELQHKRLQQQHAGAMAITIPFVQLQQVEEVSVVEGGSCTGAECPSQGSQVGSNKRTRLHMRIYSERPYWGILNITGDLVDWSFTHDVAAGYATKKPGSPATSRTHIVRLTSQHQDPSWPFWVDVQAPVGARAGTNGQWGIHVELSIADLTRTEVLEDVMALLPDYMAETWLATIHHSHWNF